MANSRVLLSTLSLPWRICASQRKKESEAEPVEIDAVAEGSRRTFLPISIEKSPRMEPGSDFSGFVALRDAKGERQITQQRVREVQSTGGRRRSQRIFLSPLTRSSNGPGRRRQGPPSLETNKSGSGVSSGAKLRQRKQESPDLHIATTGELQINLTRSGKNGRPDRSA